ncbi:MAG TPA: glycerol-3-phosphate dehydrogenase [Gemmatimonadales bacterium]
MLSRPATLAQLSRTRFDLLVVGGGITGAGVARDAALRGLSVALVERADFASGTSSRSSRLVHGGVRYLEHGHLRLVFEASRERRLLLRLAPHLVRPLAFTWPVYRGARVPRWKLHAGLLLYDVLARFRNVGRHDRLGAAEVLAREPALRAEGLTGGALYWDAATDDARLTLANVLGAADAGAAAVNHCAVRSLLREGGRVAGAVVHERFTGTELAVRADVVVNAAGPWCDEIRAMDRAPDRAAVRGTKGVHLLVPRDRVANDGAVTLLAGRDGRVLFVLPAGRFTLVGTTDTRTTMHPCEVRATEADVSYLLEVVNSFFPAASLTPGDVVSAWAGLRPLVAAGQEADGAADAPGAASREHALHWSVSGLLTVSGGKLTTYRAMAEEVVDAVVDRLRRRAAPCQTARTPLPGGDLAELEEEIERCAAATGDTAAAEWLVRAHGTRWRRVRALVASDPRLGERLSPAHPYIAAEVVHAARQEMACTVGDVLIRRAHLAFETPDHGRAAAPLVADLLAPLTGRGPTELVAEYEGEVEGMFGIEA